MNLSKIILLTSRIIVGFTFLFSGFVKCIDPLGFAYKILEYVSFCGSTLNISFCIAISIFLSSLEFIVGAFLLLGLFKRSSSLLALLFMLFFTPLTLWIAISNPVKDCGCFGDIFVISNWHTFYKNILLLICSIILFRFKCNINSLYSKFMGIFAKIFIVGFIISFSLVNLLMLPIFDLRPYKIGVNIKNEMSVDKSDLDIFENVFIYSKNGEKKSFSQDNYPWNDSTWTFVEMKTKLLKKGKSPSITDFEINKIDNSNQIDITDSILNYKGNSFLVISRSLDDIETNKINYLIDINTYSKKNNIPFFFITSSTVSEIQDFKTKYKLDFNFFQSDKVMLKTIIRSNPGLLALKNGTIIGKWSNFSIPLVKDLSNYVNTEKDYKKNNSLNFIFILSLLIFPLLLLKTIDKFLIN